MIGFKDALAEAADDARVYDVTDRALRTVRRQRLATRLAPAAVALLVTAGLATAGVRFDGGDDAHDAPAVAGIPARLTPQPSPPSLPEHRGVGRASLAYVDGGDDDEHRWVVVTTDGGQYRVKALRLDKLSPDGRWLLALLADGSTVLRDLTGTTRLDLAGGNTRTVAHWSPDSRRLVVQVWDQSTNPDTLTTSMLDLTTGARTTVPLDPTSSGEVCALRNSGVLLLCASPYSPFSGLRLADGTTGQVIRDIPADRLGLRPTETVRPLSLLSDPALGGTPTLGRDGLPVLGPDDHTMYLRTRETPAPDSSPGAQSEFLVGYDLDTGRLTERYPMPTWPPPAQRPINGGLEFGFPDRRAILGFHPDGPLLLHIAPGDDDPFTVGSVSIELIARHTGTVRVVTRLSRPVQWICYPG